MVSGLASSVVRSSKMATIVVVDTAVALKAKLQDYEATTHSHFVHKYSDKDFFEDDMDALLQSSSNPRIMWSLSAVTDRGLSLPFSGVPFMFLGNRTLACHHGPDLNRATKQRQRERNAQSDLPSAGKRRYLIQPTKKMDCPVVIHMKKVVKFPKFRINEDSEYVRRCTTRLLKKAINDYRSTADDKKHRLKMVLEYHVLFPDPVTHENHVMQETFGLREPMRSKRTKTRGSAAEMTGVDDELEPRVEEADDRDRNCGFLNNPEVVALLPNSSRLKTDHAAVATINAQELDTEARPVDRTMSTLQAKLRMRFGKIDNGNLTTLAETLRGEGHSVYFVPTSVTGTAGIQLQASDFTNGALSVHDEDAECKLEVTNACLAFVFQSADMKRLYRRYGNQLVVIDAVYRGGRYSLPTFFLMVRTNVYYQPVALFAVQQETVQTISTALNIIKDWNPDVYPRYAMVDSSEQEISALEQTFPGISVYICDYHREQSWHRWLTKFDSGVSVDIDRVKTRLRKIANAATVEEMERAVAEFESSMQFTANGRLMDWFHNVWKPLLTKWSLPYFSSEFLFIILTNNGTKNRNEDFNYDFITRCQQLPLSRILEVIVRQFLPQQYCSYVEQNVRSSCLFRQYNEDLPEFLRNRPRRIIDDMHRKMMSVGANMTSSVQMKSGFEGVFLVQGSMSSGPDVRHVAPIVYEVSFGSESTCCDCTCPSFQRTRLLCKHFCAVFQAVPGWNFDRVSPVYSCNPLLVLDEEVLAREARLSSSSSQSAGCLTDSHRDVTGDDLSNVGNSSSVNVSSTTKSAKRGYPSALRTERRAVKSLLSKLSVLTDSVDEVGTLRWLRQRLENVRRQLTNSADGRAVCSGLADLRKRPQSAVVCRPSDERHVQIRVSKSCGQNGLEEESTTYFTIVTAPPGECDEQIE